MENFLTHTDKDREQMLSCIGIKNIDELFDMIPDSAKFKDFDMPNGLDEIHASKKVKGLAKLNNTEKLCFLGGGSYLRHIPAAISAVTSRFEFLSAYTPYQPEISQGTLQAMYEFQTYITTLCNTDVSNASVYDGASALAEALLMAVRLKKKNKVFVKNTINPKYIEVVKTYLWAQDIEVVIGETPDNDDFSAVAYQYPNYFGEIEEPLTSKNGEIVVASVDLVTLSVIEPPKADIYTGDFGSFGLALNFGGPYGGFVAVKDEYKRQLPGRIIGKTIDKNGKDAYCLTLAAREQHIRREKATSNICSNQSLCALTASIYLSLMGKDGLQKVAIKSYENAHKLANMLIENGFKVLSKDFFQEFVIEVNSADKFLENMSEKGIWAGIKIDENKILLATTEVLDDENLEYYLKSAKESN